MPWLLFGSNSTLSLILSIVIKLVAVAVILFVPLFLLFEVDRRFDLYQQEKIIYFLYLVGILIGKGIRYAYWRRRSEWA